MLAGEAIIFINKFLSLPKMFASFFGYIHMVNDFIFCYTQRDDIEVLDEPLYGTFLHMTDVKRPYREDVLSKMLSHISLTNVFSFCFLSYILNYSLYRSTIFISLKLRCYGLCD